LSGPNACRGSTNEARILPVFLHSPASAVSYVTVPPRHEEAAILLIDEGSGLLRLSPMVTKAVCEVARKEEDEFRQYSLLVKAEGRYAPTLPGGWRLCRGAWRSGGPGRDAYINCHPSCDSPFPRSGDDQDASKCKAYEAVAMGITVRPSVTPSTHIVYTPRRYIVVMYCRGVSSGSVSFSSCPTSLRLVGLSL